VTRRRGPLPGYRAAQCANVTKNLWSRIYKAERNPRPAQPQTAVTAAFAWLRKCAPQPRPRYCFGRKAEGSTRLGAH
jgi:hypothetical protein